MWPPTPYLSGTALFGLGFGAFFCDTVASGAPKNEKYSGLQGVGRRVAW
jgi:hypothetical protein